MRNKCMREVGDDVKLVGGRMSKRWITCPRILRISMRIQESEPNTSGDRRKERNRVNMKFLAIHSCFLLFPS